MTLETVIDRATVAEIVRGLGSLDATRRDLEEAICKAYGVKKVDDLRARVRQFLDLEGEDRIEFEGFAATLGTAPKPLILDETHQALTDDVIVWSYRQGFLKLDPTAFKAAAKRDGRELSALRSAVHETDGTRPLSIGRAQ